MRKTWTLGATSSALVAVLATGGCYDFDKAKEQCIQDGRCEPEGSGPDGGGGDAGTDAGFDAGCTPVPGTDLPDDTFADTNCDGVDGQADAGLFVDPANGSDETGAGTRQSPLRTLGRALTLLREADGGGPVRLYLAGGAYDEAGLELNVPVSLHGGYLPGADGWGRSASTPSRLNGGTVGLTVRDLRDAGIVLEYVNVTSEDALAPGEPSIAMRMVGSSDVRLRHALIEAGQGAPGQDGADGGAGAGGADGGPGSDASGTGPGNAGIEGTNTCAEGGARSGGLGGAGITKQAGSPGQPGNPAPPRGGSEGSGGASGAFSCNDAGTSCTCSSEPGLEGGMGATGALGSAGGAGSGSGALQGETWRPSPEQTGGTGGVGEAGAGGGGGGSGGSCPQPTVSVAASGGGGGGGAGGCGGTGGNGGGGGGASIALLLLDSQVSLEDGTQLTTRGGGRGGRGGNGGNGGPGGVGGNGGNGDTFNTKPATAQYLSVSGGGGPGGKGGPGGNGGPGGGGGGGPSVGVWCDASARLDVADAGVTLNPGDGGPGGVSQGNTGGPGAREPIIGCPLNP